ncbi:unnamed protein product [Bursaphelenchus xylophilus]|uniref:(pine wood nematode) hypothetical protein n=1 Tax=Bursaphelenchus xylophilus TaxID=6326 RepID=A0A7I8WSV9_BURXY|nr:unnamed protein product [Bursaphelenchus xylophilus]CAG9115828.1 unnamed protein product [Bursaphelenchus xylophilus]
MFPFGQLAKNLVAAMIPCFQLTWLLMFADVKISNLRVQLLLCGRLMLFCLVFNMEFFVYDDMHDYPLINMSFVLPPVFFGSLTDLRLVFTLISESIPRTFDSLLHRSRWFFFDFDDRFFTANAREAGVFPFLRALSIPGSTVGAGTFNL